MEDKINRKAMKFYCTAGRGTEIFVAAELEQVFGPDVKVTSTDGKSYFNLTDCQCDDGDVWHRLMSLKTVERVFVEVLHENFQKLDRRGLLTLLHTKLNDKVIWEDCISTLNGVLVTCPSSPQSVYIEERSGNRISACSSDTDRPGSSDTDRPGNSDTDVSGSTTKRRKIDFRNTMTFRVSCRFSGYARKQLNIQRTSKQMGVLISKLLGWQIDLRQPRHEVNIYLSDDTFTVGIPLTKVPLSKRSYIKHCGLRTPVAWIMAGQLDIEPGDVVLDPMCGTGTILLEASHTCQDAVYIGMDTDISQLNLAAENIAHNNKMEFRVTLIHGDSRHIPMLNSSVDKVVTDAPFGQNHIVTGDLQMFYNHFLTEITRVVKPNGKIIVLTSTNMAPFLQRVCDRSVTSTHHLREPSPSITKCDRETVQKGTETSLSNATFQTDAIVGAGNTTFQTDAIVDAIVRAGNTTFQTDAIVGADNAISQTSDSTVGACSTTSRTEFAISEVSKPTTQSTAAVAGASKQDITQCNDRDRDWSSSVDLMLKATYNVKLGETEGCIYVLLNSEKLKHF